MIHGRGHYVNNTDAHVGGVGTSGPGVYCGGKVVLFHEVVERGPAYVELMGRPCDVCLVLVYRADYHLPLDHVPRLPEGQGLARWYGGLYLAVCLEPEVARLHER